MQITNAATKRPTDSATGAVFLHLMMPVVAASVVLSVQLYLGGKVNLPAALMVASLALLIYAANGFSDGAEDAVNDPARAAALRRNASWTLTVSGAGLVVAALLLAASGKLHAFYALILVVGIAYSFRIIPHPLGRGRAPIRLKEVLLVKNISIGATWAGAAFLGPVLDLDNAPGSPGRVAIVGVSYALLVAVVSLFCDVRDERGDRAAQVTTVPVRFGAERSFGGTFAVMGLWTAFLCAACAREVLDAPHLVFLAAAALGYPLTVWLVVTKLRPSQAISNGVIESADIFFALSLVALSS